MGSAAPPLYDEPPIHRYRFIDNAGEGFSFGLACGSAFYAIKGFRSSAAGGRLAGAGHAALVNAPRIGGMCAALAALFCASDSAMAIARRKDDSWNKIVAGTTSLGMFRMHLGARAAAVSALFGAAISVAFVGLDPWLEGELESRRVNDPTTRMKNPGLPAPAMQPPHPRDQAGALSWLKSSAMAPSPSITSNKVLFQSL
ncbi:hypothetical protein HU200_036077 [Digitaria exilis]|uniref:Uncharacterized protein n=1 Tax=Digitaria exilis TaxID=1010633 RepID=A0A835BH40_9POAL|nr:hypothetical protein HU200_036077 [Digitaria exilis]